MAQEFFEINHINEVKYGPVIVRDHKYEPQTIVAKGRIGEHDFAIINRNFHPCSYIRLNDDSPFVDKDYDDIPLDCHYGLTYKERHTNLGFEELQEGTWIGWDYGHCGDFCRYDDPDDGDHKYTVAELINELIFACGHLTALEECEGRLKVIVKRFKKNIRKLKELNKYLQNKNSI